MKINTKKKSVTVTESELRGMYLYHMLNTNFRDTGSWYSDQELETNYTDIVTCYEVVKDTIDYTIKVHGWKQV